MRVRLIWQANGCKIQCYRLRQHTQKCTVRADCRLKASSAYGRKSANAWPQIECFHCVAGGCTLRPVMKASDAYAKGTLLFQVEDLLHRQVYKVLARGPWTQSEVISCVCREHAYVHTVKSSYLYTKRHSHGRRRNDSTLARKWMPITYRTFLHQCKITQAETQAHTQCIDEMTLVCTERYTSLLGPRIWTIFAREKGDMPAPSKPGEA